MSCNSDAIEYFPWLSLSTKAAALQRTEKDGGWGACRETAAGGRRVALRGRQGWLGLCGGDSCGVKVLREQTSYRTLSVGLGDSTPTRALQKRR